MAKKQQITRIRPADENHQVVTLEGGDSSVDDYQRRPCKTCPWRKDAVGEFPAEAFRHSAETAADMSMHSFACHTAGLEHSKTCAGFLLSYNAQHNLAVRFQNLKRGCEPDVTGEGIELFDTYKEMAVANGVPEDDPVLRQCRMPTELEM